MGYIKIYMKECAEHEEEKVQVFEWTMIPAL